MNKLLPPRYYLDNFHFLIEWVRERYADLMDDSERNFVDSFIQLDPDSQCLLVRMIGRKGLCFRADKLIYAEIEHPAQAAEQLIAGQFISLDKPLDIGELARLLSKPELLLLFGDYLQSCKAARKEILLEILCDHFPVSQSWSEWTGNRFGNLYHLQVQPIVDTLLLLFFGNAHQDLTEFVLQDLGLFCYEQYVIDPQHRIFKHREEILQYQQLLILREQLYEAVDIESLVKIAQQLPGALANPAMERRRARLINQLAYEFERYSELDHALQLYRQTQLPPSRERQIRLLEKSGNYQQAWQLLTSLKESPVSEHELQIAERIAPRLGKKLGIASNKKTSSAVIKNKLVLPQLSDENGCFLNVEEIARRYFHRDDAPCVYAENELFNGLLGLWLWPEMFRSTEGAFANPFQAAPLDMYQDNFQQNRPDLAQLWQLLDEQCHGDPIYSIWQQKQGIANHFVSWQFLDKTVLQLALQCIPAQHLKLIFQRLLFDVKANRSGLPDLIQFFPASNSYRMIEIKGPGDRVQDNQQRWLNFFSANAIPAEVCYVSWQ